MRAISDLEGTTGCGLSSNESGHLAIFSSSTCRWLSMLSLESLSVAFDVALIVPRSLPSLSSSVVRTGGSGWAAICALSIWLANESELLFEFDSPFRVRAFADARCLYLFYHVKQPSNQKVSSTNDLTHFSTLQQVYACMLTWRTIETT